MWLYLIQGIGYGFAADGTNAGTYVVVGNLPGLRSADRIIRNSVMFSEVIKPTN